MDGKTLTSYSDLGSTSFSGTDIEVWAYLSGATREVQSIPFRLDSVQVFSLSCFREKVPVRSLGHTNALSYTRGPRTFAGSLITTIIHKHPLYDLLLHGWGADTIWDLPPNQGHGFSFDEQARGLTFDRRYMPDSLPPMNFIIKFANELGNRALMVVYGVEFTHDGTTMSIDDILTEDAFQYVARDALVLVSSPGDFRPYGASNIYETFNDGRIPPEVSMIPLGTDFLDDFVFDQTGSMNAEQALTIVEFGEKSSYRTSNSVTVFRARRNAPRL